MSGKVLINCAFGKSDAERATIAFLAASAAAASDRETTMFLTSDAIQLATKEGANGIEAAGYNPLSTFRDALMENGGKLWVCPACAAAHGLQAEDLIDGAELAGIPRVIEYTDNGAVTLM